MDKQKLLEAIDIYFNVTLKNSLNYRDTFKVSFPSDRSILLASDNYSQLIRLMLKNSKLKQDIEVAIENGLNIKSVGIQILDDTYFFIRY